MGRAALKHTPNTGNDIPEDVAEQKGQAAQELLALQAGYGQGRDLLNQLLGQAQAFQAAGNLLQTFGVSKLAIVKENKLYQSLSGQKTPNGLELKGTWVEFCELLGISDEKANQDIANLQVFGEDALEQMQRVGIGYRDLRQFRKLPADQKTALIEAAKGGDKDTLLELAEDLIAKHAKEKEDLQNRLEDMTGEREAALDNAGKRTKELTELKAKLNRIAKQPLDEQLAMLSKEAIGLATEAAGLLLGNVRQGLIKLQEHAAEHGSDVSVTMAGMVGQVQLVLTQLRQEFDLPDVSTAADQVDAEAWAEIRKLQSGTAGGAQA